MLLFFFTWPHHLLLCQLVSTIIQYMLHKRFKSNLKNERKWLKVLRTICCVHYAVYSETTASIGIISVSISYEVRAWVRVCVCDDDDDDDDDALLLLHTAKRWKHETAPLETHSIDKQMLVSRFIGLHNRTNSIAICAIVRQCVCVDAQNGRAN